MINADVPGLAPATFDESEVAATQRPHDSNDTQLLLRRRDTARKLGLSERKIIQLETAGVLPVVRIPGMRAARHYAPDVNALALKWAATRTVGGAA